MATDPIAEPLLAPTPLSAGACQQARDGNVVARVQEEVERLLPKLQADPTYAGAWYEHAPCYRIVFAFTDRSPRPWVMEAASAHLRPYIELRTAKYSYAEIDQARVAITAALASKRLGQAYIFQENPQRFIVHVRTAAEAPLALEAVPNRYRPDTIVRVGELKFTPELFSAEPMADAPAPGEYVGPSDAEDREMYPRRSTLGAAELQLFVVPLNRKVRNLPGFSDIYIEHVPRWHVVVAFTRPPPADEVIALAPRTIRDRIIIHTAKRTQEQIGADLEATTVAVNRLGIDYTGGYDPKTQRFHIMVGAPAMVERVRAVLPASVRVDTDIKVGALPVPERALPRSQAR